MGERLRKRWDMHCMFGALGALFFLLDTVSPLLPPDQGSNITTARWDVGVPDTITVKKASHPDNVEKAVRLTAEQEQAILVQHNVFREIAEPTATNMRKMTWDDELAKLATEYSRKCIYEHNPERSHSRFRYVGENLYISTGMELNIDMLKNAVWAWDNEKHDYDYETTDCEPGKKCGHYTQIVWDDTFKVGCGVTICREVYVKNEIWKSATLFACNYGPGGNYPRQPFISGPPCSGCSEGDSCVSNLCTNPIRDEVGSVENANWNEWSAWSACSTTCLGGSAKRERKCNTFVDTDCVGSPWEMTFTCSPNLCDLVKIPQGGEGRDSDFLPWRAWSACSQTCGMGIVTRTRSCKNGGARCSGINFLRSSCNKGDCKDFDVAGRWWNWGPWQACSVTCGEGIQKRKRACMKANTCKGNREAKKRCRVVTCSVPAAARWSAWSKWSACTATCGGGSRTKRRNCLTGDSCEGAETETEGCNALRCPAKYSPWSTWEECSATCGPTGTRVRTRHCVGDTACVGSSTDSERCNTVKCPEYGPWNNWGDCDITCGSGYRIRSRICYSANSDDCEGEDTSAVVCNMAKCTLSGWSSWSPWSRCSVSCGGGTKSSTRLCNIGNSGPTCSGDSVKRRQCKTHKCPEFSAWSTWSSCDATCGEGKKSRFRSCDEPNGNGCRGARNEMEDCKVTDCTKSRWKDWSTWTACSVTCGSGKRTRSRDCVVGSIGPPCLGSNDEVKSCNTKLCGNWVNSGPQCDGGWQCISEILSLAVSIFSIVTLESGEGQDEKDPPNESPEGRNNQKSEEKEAETPGGGASGIAPKALTYVASAMIVTFVSIYFHLVEVR